MNIVLFAFSLLYSEVTITSGVVQGRVFTISEPIISVQPHCPRASAVSTHIELQLTVDTKGVVKKVYFRTHVPDLELKKLVEEYVRTWRYKPENRKMKALVSMYFKC